LSSRSRFVPLALLAGATFLSVVAAGCAQTAGEPCQLASDCESGLTCCKLSDSSSVSDLGICRTEAACTAFMSDSGATETDGGSEPDEDAGSETDSGTPETDSGMPETDSGTPDTDSGAPETDSGAPSTDSGTPDVDSGMPAADSGPGDDAGTDAGSI
jgi:hypothetical protein